MTSLEREFENFKIGHKSAVIKAVALKYYGDLYDSEINLPEFIESKEDVVERKASNYLLELANDNNRFNKVYENCWERVKEYLP